MPGVVPIDPWLGESRPESFRWSFRRTLSTARIRCRLRPVNDSPGFLSIWDLRFDHKVHDAEHRRTDIFPLLKRATRSIQKPELGNPSPNTVGDPATEKPRCFVLHANGS